MQHDGTLKIATGRSRKEIQWKTREVLWSDLVKRLQVPVRTSETYTEYLKESKPRQDEIKDVGGFVGGTLRGGRRKGGAVLDRCLITLDADFATPDFWQNALPLQTFAAAVYSTHKHSAGKPRLRIVIPMKRPVTPDEYKAIARLTAADYGIELFDDTTYDPSRLMYWPSASQGADFFFDLVDEPWLDPDEQLARYADWRDTTQWPESSRAVTERKKTADKQGDPTTKPGLVGAFCRVYDIRSAIDTFLTDVYTPTAEADRYTYAAGSTAGGVVIYDGARFAYSHHGTDPAGDRLLNAYDLVRIHKYGEKDADAEYGTPTNRLPSTEAMHDFCKADPGVIEELGRMRLQQAAEDFGVDDEPAAAPEAGKAEDLSWMTKLEHDQNGKIKGTRRNILLILGHDPKLKDSLGFNEFIHRPMITGPVPWKTKPGQPWEDRDECSIRIYFEGHYGINARDKISDALADYMYRRKFHPVRQYLDGLQWDGEHRVETLLIDVMGAPDSGYTRAVTRKWITAAVTRIREPGCKMDYLIVLKGPQGVGKSRLFAKLGRQDLGWFSDTPVPFDDPKAVTEVTNGKWIVEMGEMSGLRKAEQEAVKRCISSQAETVRQAYGHFPSTYLRQCVFAGTTNRDDYIPDPTGGRRFWPIDVDTRNATRTIEEYLTPATVDQIWAEADVLYTGGEELYLPPEIEAQAYDRQQAHSALDERGTRVREYLDKLIPEGWYEMRQNDRLIWLQENDHELNPGVNRREFVCAMEIWVECFQRRESDLDRRNSQAITDIMMQFRDWYRSPDPIRIGGYGKPRAFRRQGT